jgi:hypothetical protein
MPSYACKHPTCTNYLNAKGYCAECVQLGRQQGQSRHTVYDQHCRNPERKKFYNSTAWRIARRTKLTHSPGCERCRVVFAQHVHHVIPLEKCTLQQRTEQTNLLAVCTACHNIIEGEARNGGQTL